MVMYTYSACLLPIDHKAITFFQFFRRLNKKKGKKGQQQADPKDGKKSVAAGKASIAPSTDRIAPKSQGGPKPHDSDHNAMKVGSSTERPESHQTEKSDTQLDADGK